MILDFRAAIRYPFGLEYGEGIVWQQALLIPGPHMYGDSQELPFIAFHYPPLYYLLAHAALWLEPNFLAAGRLVSAISAVAIAVAVAALVRLASDRPRLPSTIAIAAATGLLVLCLDPVRSWGGWMRVDTAAVALGMAGLVIAARADRRFWYVTAALLLCVASLFTKQTQLAGRDRGIRDRFCAQPARRARRRRRRRSRSQSAPCASWRSRPTAAFCTTSSATTSTATPLNTRSGPSGRSARAFRSWC